MDKVNLPEVLPLHDHWQPKIVGDLNDHQVKLVKFQGEFVWHKHDDGGRDVPGRRAAGCGSASAIGDVELAEGELFIVPKGVEHMPVGRRGVLGRPDRARDTLNTGDVERRADGRGARADLTPPWLPSPSAPGQRPRRLLRRPDLHRLRRLPADRAGGLRRGRRPLLRRARSRRRRGERRRALMALVACPTGSIGTRRARTTPPAGSRAFPETVDGERLLLRLHVARLLRRVELLHRAARRATSSSTRRGRPAAALGARAPRRRRDAVPDAPGRRRRPRGLPPALRLRARPPRGRRHARHARRRAAALGPRPGPPRRRPPRDSDARPHARPRRAPLPATSSSSPATTSPGRARRGTASSPSATPAGTRGTEQIRSMERLLDFSLRVGAAGPRRPGTTRRRPTAMRRELERCVGLDEDALGRLRLETSQARRTLAARATRPRPDDRPSAQSAPSASRTAGGRLRRREDDDAASPARAAGLAAPGARRPRPRRSRRSMRGRRRRPARAAGGPPTRRRAPRPSRRSRPAAAASAISRAAARDSVEVPRRPRGRPRAARGRSPSCSSPTSARRPVSKSVRCRSQAPRVDVAALARSVAPGSKRIVWRPPASGG